MEIRSVPHIENPYSFCADSEDRHLQAGPGYSFPSYSWDSSAPTPDMHTLMKPVSSCPLRGTDHV